MPREHASGVAYPPVAGLRGGSLPEQKVSQVCAWPATHRAAHQNRRGTNVKLLKAFDAALTAFVNTLWPLPAPTWNELWLQEKEATEDVAESSPTDAVSADVPVGASPGSDLGVPLAADPGHPIVVRVFEPAPPSRRERTLALAAIGLETWISGRPCQSNECYHKVIEHLDRMSGGVRETL